MTEDRCPGCTSTSISKTYRVPDHEYGLDYCAAYHLCISCATLYQSPMPDLETLASFYPSDYHSMAAGGLLADLRHRARLRRLRTFVQRPLAIVLDYGCGDGAFLYYVAQKQPDWRLWGFEIASQPSTERSADGRVTIVRGRPPDLLAELSPCDLITMNHVIEHLPNPADVLRQLCNRLTPNGVLEGQTPAADSFERAVFGEAWSGFHAPRHTVIFSRAGLHAILRQVSLCEAEVTGTFNPAGIAVSLASAFHGRRPGRIRRRGARWLAGLLLATVLYPIDGLSGAPGIVNFVARKPAAAL